MPSVALSYPVRPASLSAALERPVLANAIPSKACQRLIAGGEFDRFFLSRHQSYQQLAQLSHRHVLPLHQTAGAAAADRRPLRRPELWVT